jgi:hypothetical protein
MKIHFLWGFQSIKDCRYMYTYCSSVHRDDADAIASAAAAMGDADSGVVMHRRNMAAALRLVRRLAESQNLAGKNLTCDRLFFILFFKSVP